jgi:Major Facilitator Superfamily
VTPALSALSHRHGPPAAVAEVVLALLAVLIPLVMLGIGAVWRGKPDHRCAARKRTGARPTSVPRRPCVIGAFGLSLLIPVLGPGGGASAVAAAAIAAMLGRIGLGLVVDRIDQRRVSAASFISQAIALGVILSFQTYRSALYTACSLFGLSVGNVITLPSVIVQREFAARSFGLVLGLSSGFAQITFAFGPALLGLIRDLAGDYVPALAVCIALELAAAVIILRGRPDHAGLSLAASVRPLSLALLTRRQRHR